MGKLTIREIAKMAGVSPTAVSFVINGKDGIKDETRKRILEVIERTNFIPSMNSRRLFFQKSYNISLIIQNTASPFSNLFYFEVTRGLLEKSKEYNYNIVFTDIKVEGNNVILPNIITNKDTDGIIFFQDTDKAILNEMDRLEIPFVIVDAHNSDANYTYVNSDCELSAFTATNHLISQGHTNIAFIGSCFIPDFYLQVFTGFSKALNTLQQPLSSSWMQIKAIDEETAYECMKEILSCKPYPTAVFCAGDIFAIGAMRCCKDLGISVPDDISVIGIDDIVLSQYIDPPLTTIRFDKASMGKIAMELLAQKIDGQQVDSIIIPSDQLIIRKSVRNISNDML